MRIGFYPPGDVISRISSVFHRFPYGWWWWVVIISRTPNPSASMGELSFAASVQIRAITSWLAKMSISCYPAGAVISRILSEFRRLPNGGGHNIEHA